MSRAGEVWDNSAVESFFSSMKTERTASHMCRCREQVRVDLFDNIERFYSPVRLHSTLGYFTPVSSNKLKKLRPVSTKPEAAKYANYRSNSAVVADHQSL